MIRNAVLHLHNEQPLLADLYALPSPGDVTVVCTNLRTSDGKRPVFIDHSRSTFVFPYIHIRFLEIPPGAVAADIADRLRRRRDRYRRLGAADRRHERHDDDADELDEDFLKRVRDI